ncbi:hypothetical protein Fmac_007835 [Flemingia macrophylla]|uniref:Uncharacterized protein n=1 Tax=Flemingia macrophylla TaxID=520843 RepID=A0ABD1MVN8_9FABA
MMKGREGKAIAQAAPSTDLLVCFPSRMPKAICSPARPSEPNKRHHHHQRKKSFSRGQASPLVWAKSKAMGSEVAEPTSPKVTCAGQIKVRPKSGTWQSVMEEIEKIHTDNKKQRKRRLSWAESTLGFKKEIMQFLTCLRSIRLDLRCFGSFHDEDEEDEEAEDEDASRTVFSKWFMLLQENQGAAASVVREEDQSVSVSVSVPPPNALLLMRCRSAPAKSWVREEENYQERQKEEKKGQSLKSLMEEENNNSNMVLMRYDSDFYDVSSDVAKETWIVGGIRDLMSRTRSCKT